MNNFIRILIGADFVPTDSNKDLFCSGDVESLFDNKLLDLIDSSDVRLFNLEAPLIDYSAPIMKCGPIIGIDKNVINGIKKLKPTCFTLSNNHIMDHGSSGLECTIKTLNDNHIDFCGVGDNINNLSSYWIKEIDGINLCVYTCAEHEFSIATQNSAGANPFDPLTSYNEVEQISKKSDFVIVLYHGGKEFYPYPSPDLQLYCRKFVDSGADLVICQHSHCIGSEEDYNGKKIIYGQGNFLFDDGTKILGWDNGLLLDVKVSKKHKLCSLDYVVLSRKNNGVVVADDKEFKKIMSDYKNRSNNIKSEKFIQDSYSKFANHSLSILLRKYDLLGNTFLFRFLNKITKQKFGELYFNKIYLRRKSFDLQNAIECEAWRELALRGIKDYNEKRGIRK